MNIDQKLKDARKNAGITQEDLAEKLHVSRQTISSWENGRSYPDIVSIVLLSDIYGISLDDLLKGDDKMLKKLEKDTDVVKSNRKLIGIYLALMIGYAVLYVVLPMLPIPKLENLFINVLILVAAGLALLYHLFKYVKRSDFIHKSTSNVQLAKIAMLPVGNPNIGMTVAKATKPPPGTTTVPKQASVDKMTALIKSTSDNSIP